MTSRARVERLLGLWPDGRLRINLFLAGSPKCGTTSLAYWLSQHPAVFFSEPKEPNFFNDLELRCVRDPRAYSALFDAVADQHKIIAEGSTYYLSSPEAIAGILKFNPRARFVVIVRGPASMAFSMHAMFRRAFVDDVDDFEDAWRRCGSGRRSRTALDYRHICMQGKHLRHLIEQVGRERVFIGHLESMKADPIAFMGDVCRFLGVPASAGIELASKNVAYDLKSRSLAKGLRRAVKLKDRLAPGVRTGLWTWLDTRNRKPADRRLSASLEREIEEFFREDWSLVEGLLEEQARD